MVLALLAGRKTQTRRIVKAPHIDCADVWAFDAGSGEWESGECHQGPTAHVDWVKPYALVGDRLWGRETWRLGAWRPDGRVAIDYRATPEQNRTPWLRPLEASFKKLRTESEDDCRKAVEANRGSVHEGAEGGFLWERGDSPARWRPSIFMPRWASRLLHEVTAVRVERLQDISEADAIAEGLVQLDPNGFDGAPMWGCPGLFSADFADPRAAYRELWESINGPESWAANPWVWVVSFRKVES